MRNKTEIQQAAGFVSKGRKYKNLSDSTDEMSAALAQFRNRRDYEKSSNLSNSFERVLEDEEAFTEGEANIKLISVHVAAR